MRERGFIPLSILGSPTVWLALGCALLAFTSWAMYGRWQAAVEREAKIKGEFAGFVEAVKQRGLEQERQSAEKEAKDREQFKLIKARYSADLARRDADLKRLRDAPITRPDSSEVPVTRIGPERPDGTAAQYIPVEEFRALEERAYDDALRLTRLQEWVRAVGHPVE